MARSWIENADEAGSAKTVIGLSGEKKIELPDGGFTADAQILRDGQDLILEAPNGETVVIENYFSADPAPVLAAPDGSALTPALVESFARFEGPVQLAGASDINDVSPVGAVKEVSGEATVTRANGTVETLTVGSPVYQGDIVETDASGAVNIQFSDQSTFAVSQNARLAIDEYVFDPASAGGGESNFSLLRGVFVFTSGLIGRDDPDDVRIETPVGSIGIRGTTIIGTINPDGESHITVVEGAIVVTNEYGSTTLSDQYETATLSGGVISNIGVLDQDAVGETYNVLRSVSPEFFAGMDAVGAGTAPAAPEQPVPDDPAAEDAPAAGAAAPEYTDSADEPADAQTDAVTDPAIAPDTTVAPEGEAPAGEILPPPNSTIMLDTTFDGGGDVFTAALPPPPSGTYIVSTEPVLTTTTTILPPPPSPPVGTVQLQPPPPPPPPPVAPPPPLLLNTISAPDGFLIATGAAGSFLGSNLAALGDYDSDGIMDYVYVDKIDPATYYINGTPFAAPFAGNESQLSVSGIGDFDGDGFLDFVLGAPFSDDSTFYVPGPGGTGNAMVVSGAGGVMFELDGIGTNARAGARVDGIGDIDGDGFSDAIVSADSGAGTRGQAYVLLGGSAPPVLDVTNLATNGFSLTGDAIGDRLGNRVSGAGDFNRDGYSDFILTSPGSGEIMVGFGLQGADSADYNPATGMGFLTITLAVSPPNTLPVTTLGDFNGDGISDISITDVLGDAGRGIVHVLYGKPAYTGGGSLDLSGGSVAPGDGFTLRLGAGIGAFIGGGDIGDFNGDGLDDMALATRTGDMVDVYVLYGRPGLSGTITLTNTFLDNPANGFHMEYDLQMAGLADPVNDPYKFSLLGVGDRNGDGFDDLLVGTPDYNGGQGQVFLVNGRSGGAPLNTTGTATAAGDHLVGTAGADMLRTGGFGGVRMNGGGGNDQMVIDNVGVASIDGGTGYDTLRLMGAGKVLDFTNASTNPLLRGSESLSGVERFNMLDTGQIVKLGLDDIFRLLQESDNGSLTIMESGDGTNTTSFAIDNNAGGGGTLAGMGFVANGNTGPQMQSDGFFHTFNVYDFGGYQLLIDQNVNAVNVV